MAYVRWGDDSDVYVYSDGNSLHCLLTYHGRWKVGAYTTKDRRKMIAHLLSLREEGYSVPDRPLQRLRKEVKIND